MTLPCCSLRDDIVFLAKPFSDNLQSRYQPNVAAKRALINSNSIVSSTERFHVSTNGQQDWNVMYSGGFIFSLFLALQQSFPSYNIQRFSSRNCRERNNNNKSCRLQSNDEFLLQISLLRSVSTLYTTESSFRYLFYLQQFNYSKYYGLPLPAATMTSPIEYKDQ